MHAGQIINYNRMRHVPYAFVPKQPVLAAYRTTATAQEGSAVVFEIRRTEVLSGQCRCTWTAVSAGGSGDLSGATTGTAILESNATAPFRVTVQTVNRSGTQGDRELTLVISAAQGCVLDPTRLSASTTLRDRTASVNWWQVAGRSARPDGRLSGVSYWAAAASAITSTFGKYEAQVALIDAFNGGRPHKEGQSTATMALTHGGPTGTVNSTITPGSQLDWSASRDHFTVGWRYFPPGTWCIWAMDTIGWDRRTDGGNHTIWQEIIDGQWDVSFANLGRRMKANIDSPTSNPMGHPANRLVLRMNHENNQSNAYEVVPASKLKYKAATERAITMMRQGLGDYGLDVKFMHAPAHGSNQLGDYLSWCPDNVDCISVSWHPSVTINDADRAAKYMAGTDGPQRYGTAQLLQASIDSGLPMCFPEWSPRFEWTGTTKVACPISNTMQGLFDDFLTANADRILCDCVYHPNALNPTGYENTADAAGVQQWKDAVVSYKTGWSGTKA